MRFAALADIHGNVFALDAVLADVKCRGADALLNLGDAFYGPIAPRATYDRLRELDIVSISGNQDRQIHESTDADVAANPTLDYVLDDLGADAVAWLKTLPFDRELTDEIYLCHGSPTDDLEYLLEDVSSGRPLLRSDADITAALGGRTESLILCGHTHTARTVRLASGQLIVNPGSVGLPAYTDDAPVDHAMEQGSPHAAYAIVEKGAAGWMVEHRLVPYDHEKAAAAVKARGREDWIPFLTGGRGR